MADLACLVLDSEETTLTGAVLAACAEASVPVVVCRKHRPAGVLAGMNAAWNASEIRRLQAGAVRGSAPGRRLWRRTVAAKIRVQASALAAEAAGGDKRLLALARDVPIDAPETVEAQAAAIYWRTIFAEFERGDEGDPRNRILNWGYAVLMAAIARACVSLGLDPCLGFGHSDRANPWALCHDLMEPFRPSIDVAVRDGTLTFGALDEPAIKARIVGLFASDRPMKRAILEAVDGYRRFLDDGRETGVPYPDSPFRS